MSDTMDAMQIAALLFALIPGLITYRYGLLTREGSLSAVLIGIGIALIHPSWLFLLLIFLVAGLVATRYRFEEKRKKGVQEGVKGERGYWNVLSTGLVPLTIALLSVPSYPIIPTGMSGSLFLVAIGTAAADTLASEMGVLSPKVRLITSMKRVEPGTNGGVSAYGSIWALTGAFFTAFFGGPFLSRFSSTFPWSINAVILVGIMGFVGCMLDSLLGATLENRGIIGKGMVNFLSELGAVLITALFLWF